MVARGRGQAPGHGRGVMGDTETSVGTEKDDAAMASEAIEEIRNGLAGGELRRRTGGHAVGRPFAQDELHDWFPPSGERNGSAEVVGITTAPDEGGIANSAWSLVQCASGGGASRQVAVNVEGDGTDGVMRCRWFGREEFDCGLGAFVVAVNVSGEGFVGKSGCLPGLRMGKPRAFAVENEITVVNKLHAMGGSERFGAGTDKVDMRTLLENQASRQNGILDSLDARHATGFHATAIHEKSIELDAAIGCKKTASTCIESGVILKNHYGGLDSI